MSELKPCPFCGDKARINIEGRETDLRGRLYSVRCFPLCKAIIPRIFHELEEGIAAWNNRPIEAALEARIKELEALNTQLKEELREVGEALEQYMPYCVGEFISQAEAATSGEGEDDGA